MGASTDIWYVISLAIYTDATSIMCAVHTILAALAVPLSDHAPPCAGAELSERREKTSASTGSTRTTTTGLLGIPRDLT